jgi:hypothetical protein
MRRFIVSLLVARSCENICGPSAFISSLAAVSIDAQDGNMLEGRMHLVFRRIERKSPALP